MRDIYRCRCYPPKYAPKPSPFLKRKEEEGGGCERGRRRDNSHLEGRKEEEGERYISVYQTPIYSPPSLSLSRKREEGRKLLHP